VNHLRVDALLLSQEDFDTYLESTLLAERRIGIKYAQRGGEERLQGIISVIYTQTHIFKKTQHSMLLIFVQLCPLLSQPALELPPGNCTQWNGREGFVT
jgi:hypothetical protein